ncbi:MAG TPA: noncanonical pyrimidine nucleotidase, YjjG family [Kosmotogaceae bacterium]|nr:noncanonical pyrimidine nucleotidase, YjjG family [Kosmotogaceae bacterium]
MKYEITYLDLDHTLLEFESAEENALRLLFNDYDRKLTEGECELYKEISEKWWDLLDTGRCKKDEILVGRFREYFDRLNVKENPDVASQRYLELLSEQGITIAGAIDFLEEMRDRGQRMAAITNGVEFVQLRRIEIAGLSVYLDFVVTSERAGFTKPHPGIFHYASELSGIPIDKSVYIGDSLKTDWAGAKNAGMPFILLDLFAKEPSNNGVQVARSYEELLELLF